MPDLTTIFATIGQLAVALLLVRILSFIYTYFLAPSTLDNYLQTPPDQHAWALVTGSSDGIGLETARKLLARGFNVLLHGRNPAKLARVAERLRGEQPGRAVRFVVADSTEPWEAADSVREAVEALERESSSHGGSSGRLKVLVNNVGGSRAGSSTARAYVRLDEMAAADVRRSASMNALFPTEVTRQLLATLQRNAPALVVNVGSQAGAYGMPYVCVYAACKAYNHVFSAALRNEMLATGQGVEVVGVIVGNVESSTNDAKPDFMTLTSEQMADDVLRRVGCGQTDALVGSWRQQATQLALNLLPRPLVWRILRSAMQARRDKEDKES